MAFRFRKSIKAGPLRINLSKSGIGYSVGTKGFRYTKKASGGYRTTTSIPGTGISFVQDSAGTKKRTSQARSYISHNSQGGNNMRKPKSSKTEFLLCLFLGWAGAHKFYIGKILLGILYLFTFGFFLIGWWGDMIILCMENLCKSKGSELSWKKKGLSYIAGFLCVLLVGGCSSDSETAPAATDPTLDVVATTEVAEETAVPVTESITEVTAEPTIEHTTEATTEPTTEPTSEPTTEPATAPTTEPTEPEPEGRNYVLNLNSWKFHYPSCSSADDIKASNRKDVVATREELINQGYVPCGRCHP